MGYCDDCGCKVYDGACTNCHESIYIESQYEDLGIRTPELINGEANQCREDIERKRGT